VVELQSSDKTHWLSLGEACRLLQVNEATLRQWADQGHLRVYRTPGGHRRFWRDDVLGLTAQVSPAHDSETREKLEGSALRRIRRRLSHEDVARQPWYQSVEEEGRGRMRLFGRRLLSLLLQEAPLRRRRQDALDESLMLGHEYGTEMADRGVSLKDTIEAFVFFRTIVLDSTNSRSWGQILELADRVLLGVVESYQKRMTYISENPSSLIIQEADRYSDGLD
jgi:excisionase family DNA binding protein